MALPTLTPEQRAQALKKAAEARQARALMKTELKNGDRTLEQVFKDAQTNEIVAKTKVLAVLTALPGVGKVRAQKAMEEAGIAENRRIQGVGDKQREKLLEIFA